MTLLPLVAQIDIHVEHSESFLCLRMKLTNPEFLNFAVENISELFGYIATGRVNIRVHRDITGEMWFGVREW